MGGYRLRIDGLQPLDDRRDQLDDDAAIEILHEVEWPMPRRRSSPPVGEMLTAQQVAELNRAFLRAVADALAEIDDEGELHHE